MHRLQSCLGFHIIEVHIGPLLDLFLVLSVDSQSIACHIVVNLTDFTIQQSSTLHVQ